MRQSWAAIGTSPAERAAFCHKPGLCLIQYKRGEVQMSIFFMLLAILAGLSLLAAIIAVPILVLLLYFRVYRKGKVLNRQEPGDSV